MQGEEQRMAVKLSLVVADLALIQQPQTHSILSQAHKSTRPVYGIQHPVASLHRSSGHQHK